jgi:hypothetical protein
MSSITIHIETDNAVFEDLPYESLRHLGYHLFDRLAPLQTRSLAAIQKALDGVKLRDINGNTVGKVTVET